MRSVLVFVKRKVDADRLARAVARGGVDATSIHSDRSQAERTAALEAFRRGECPVLVATDVAGRGLDINGISHVINFDVPRSPDDYIHRAGRTARAGATGEVITFVTAEDETLIAAIEARDRHDAARRHAGGRASAPHTRAAPARRTSRRARQRAAPAPVAERRPDRRPPPPRPARPPRHRRLVARGLPRARTAAAELRRE